MDYLELVPNFPNYFPNHLRDQSSCEISRKLERYRNDFIEATEVH
jgi:hypothetical protein